jgi:hypothetical protein
LTVDEDIYKVCVNELIDDDTINHGKFI